MANGEYVYSSRRILKESTPDAYEKEESTRRWDYFKKHYSEIGYKPLPKRKQLRSVLRKTKDFLRARKLKKAPKKKILRSKRPSYSLIRSRLYGGQGAIPSGRAGAYQTYAQKYVPHDVATKSELAQARAMRRVKKGELVSHSLSKN